MPVIIPDSPEVNTMTPTITTTAPLMMPGEPVQNPSPTDAMEDAQPAIEVAGFDAWYGDYHALKDLNMIIPEKRITAFIGPSGCGKSTLLRWINRMNDLVPIARAAGTLKLDGQDLLAKSTDVVDLRRHVGMVFQKPNPFPKSIYDNVAFGPRLHMSMSRTELNNVVEQSLRSAALWDEVKYRLKSPALSLSGGQQQRLCIARAIAVGPSVLLMDEPCSALDPRSTAAIEDLMAQLRNDYTIAIVTHNMQQASRASDYSAFMFQGELIEFGDTEQVFTKPRNEQTQNYITGRFG